MSAKDWERACREAWETYYSPDHIETLMRRAQVTGVNVGKVLASAVMFYGSIRYEGVHPLESGYVRYKFREDRRPGPCICASYRSVADCEKTPRQWSTPTLRCNK